MLLNNWSTAASYDTARIFAGLGLRLLHREQVDHLAPGPSQNVVRAAARCQGGRGSQGLRAGKGRACHGLSQRLLPPSPRSAPLILVEETAMLQGGCFCGRIRYEVAGRPFHETNCHCSICRRTTGAPFVAWFSVRPSEFRFVEGDPSHFRSSGKGSRSFCPHCGTQLTFQADDHPDEVDITTCSLDHPAAVPPRDHTYTSELWRVNQWAEMALL